MLAAKLKKFLDKHNVSYQKLNRNRCGKSFKEALLELNINDKEAIKGILVSDGWSPILIVLPLNMELNLSKLEQELGRRCVLLQNEEADKYFYDCEPGNHPPIGEPYGLNMLLDVSIDNFNNVYFESGNHTVIIEMPMDEFCFLTNGVERLDIGSKIKAPEFKSAEINQTIIENPFKRIFSLVKRSSS